MVLITGCYNDNGNYDYSEINEVKIKFSHTTNDSLFVASGDTIYLNPEIIYDGDSVNLSYEWKIFDASLTKDLITNEYPKATIISDSCDLCYNVAEGPGQYILVYTVTDKTNQVKFYYSFDVSVQTVKGLAVLDLQNDNSNEIHVIQEIGRAHV